MFIDELQLAKNTIRSQKVKDLLGNKDYDDKSFKYFVDVLNELGEAMDVARDSVDTSCRDLSIESVRNVYLREKEIGNILLSGKMNEEERKSVYSYIDSVSIEYAKFLYEVGLVDFKCRLQNITDLITDSTNFDYHAMLTCMAKKYDEELKDFTYDIVNDNNRKLVIAS